LSNKIFSLEILRARKGDCLLLHYGTTRKPGLALIDGGHDNVYGPFLRPRLEELRAERGLTDDEPLIVDLMMLSHIDEDHVAGLLELTSELLDAKENDQPRIVRILDLWHNTFDDIVDNDAEELAGAVRGHFGPASLNGGLPAAVLNELKDSDTPAVAATVMVIASVPQGRQLRDDAKNLDIERNVEVGGGLIVATDEDQQLDMGKNLKFTIVGPMLPEVKKLQTAVRTWLKKHPGAQDKVTASALASLADNTPTNLSSIVVLAEAADKRILLTGDALGDKILKGLEMVGLVDDGGSIHVDVLKGQHHGSDRNFTPEFFERVTADHYVFSGNGENGNPERNTLQMLADARGDADYTIHLTYPIGEIDDARKRDWNSQRSDEERRHAAKPSVKVRANWSKAKNSLAAFLAANPDVDERVVIVGKGVPHTIDLLG
jgi:beta-lactamase superfamily II metal-dependent hydrolase